MSMRFDDLYTHITTSIIKMQSTSITPKFPRTPITPIPTFTWRARLAVACAVGQGKSTFIFFSKSQHYNEETSLSPSAPGVSSYRVISNHSAVTLTSPSACVSSYRS